MSRRKEATTNTLNLQEMNSKTALFFSLFIQDLKGSNTSEQKNWGDYYISHILRLPKKTSISYVQCQHVQNWGYCGETGLEEEHKPQTVVGRQSCLHAAVSFSDKCS